jgi:hypothetical protein
MKMRRILSLLIALGVAGLAPLPVSACALLHSHTSECAAPQTATDCERMGMHQAEETSFKVSSGNKSCCIISQAPLPEAQSWAGSFAVATNPALASNITVATQPLESVWFPDIPKTTSPPQLQSLLCTFLI